MSRDFPKVTADNVKVLRLLRHPRRKASSGFVNNFTVSQPTRTRMCSPSLRKTEVGDLIMKTAINRYDRRASIPMTVHPSGHGPAATGNGAEHPRVIPPRSGLFALSMSNDEPRLRNRGQLGKWRITCTKLLLLRYSSCQILISRMSSIPVKKLRFSVAGACLSPGLRCSVKMLSEIASYSSRSTNYPVKDRLLLMKVVGGSLTDEIATHVPISQLSLYWNIPAETLHHTNQGRQRW